MKTILCFGDSNTWGYNPDGGLRYSKNIRWPGVLKSELGEEYEIIEEGQCGRVTAWEDPKDAYKNGKEYLIPCLETHRTLDLVIIMLGTNDLKARMNLSAADIARGAGILVDMVQKSWVGPNFGAPKVLLIAPPPIVDGNAFEGEFNGGYEKSHRLGEEYKLVAEKLSCPFIDAGKIINSSGIDCIHLESEEHEKLGKAVAKSVKEIF
jgi:lysophospholipase L1-like esterase